MARLSAATERAPATGYLIVPGLSEITADNFREKNIIPVLGTLSNFISFIRELLGSSYTITDIAQERLPSFVGVLKKLGVRRAEPIVSGLYEIIPVIRDTLLQPSPPLPGLRDFYFGNAPTWRDIIDHVHAELDCYADVHAAIRSTSRLIIVHGSAGCGKTTCILDASLARSNQSGTPPTYFLEPSRDLPASAIRFLSENVDGDLPFVLDNFTQYWRSLKELCEDNTLLNVRFLVADRTNAWSRVSKEFEGVTKSVIQVRWISRNDANRILEKLETFGDWSRMMKLSEERRVQEIYENPKRQLLVALKEATTGRGFDEIINSEYSGLAGDYERASCIYIALATMHNVRLSEQTFDTLMRRRFGKICIPRDTNLEGIVIEESGGLSLRHRVIADHLVRRVVSRDDLADAIGDIMQAQARLGAPLRETAKAIEYRFFTRLTNHEFLLELFRRTLGRMVSKFDENQVNYRSDFLFWLQLALFEFNSKKELRRKALDHIGIARNIFPASFQVTNAYCQMHLEMAVDAGSESEALLMMDEASAVLEGEMTDPRTEPYALTVLALGRVKVFRKWFPGEARAEARRMIARLRDAERRYPGDSELAGARNQVALLASPTGRRIKAKPRTRHHH